MAEGTPEDVVKVERSFTVFGAVADIANEDSGMTVLVVRLWPLLKGAWL